MARKDKTVLIGIVLIAIALVAVIGIIYYISTLPKQQQIVQYPPQPTPTQYKLTLPTVFTVNDIWKGQTMTGVKIEIYKYATKELLESGTVTNTYTTTNPLTSGDRYWVKLSKEGAFKFYDITIPYESSPSASNHYITLDFYTIGSYPIKMFDPTGNSISVSGGSYNVTEQNNKYPSFTLMIGPPADDTGVMNTYDPIKTLDRQVLFFIHVSGDKSNYLIVSNIPVLYSASSTDRNFGYTLNPAELVRDKKPDGTYASEGIKSLTLTFDASGLPKGTSVRIDIYVYAFTNENYFKTYGTHPTDYMSIASTAYFYICA
jgi:hypothetical protein